MVMLFKMCVVWYLAFDPMSLVRSKISMTNRKNDYARYVAYVPRKLITWLKIICNTYINIDT